MHIHINMHSSRSKSFSQYIRRGDFELLLHLYVLFQILFYDDMLFFTISKRSWPQTFSHAYVNTQDPKFPVTLNVYSSFIRALVYCKERPLLQ